MRKIQTSGATRREALKFGAGVAAVAAPMVNVGRFRAFAQSETTYSVRALDLVGSSFVIDMLSLLRSLNRLWPESPQDDVFDLPLSQIEKIKSTGVNVFHPAVGLGGPDVRSNALAFVARWNGVFAERSDVFRRVDGGDDLKALDGSAKMGVIIGLQNASHFRNPDDVDLFHQLGQRVSQLTYNSRNLIGTGSTDRADGGLSDFGVSIVERMNKVGMAVDVSHCGDQTTLDAFAVSSKPVLITHSNARALVPGHPRCKTDDAIRAMAASGGVMGITGVRNFVRDREPTNIEHLVDHYDHVMRLIGVEHVGVGSDMDPDGYDDIAEDRLEQLKSGYKGSYGFRDKLDTDGFDHPKKIFDLADGLIRRGHTDSDIRLILGGNFRRVLSEIWSV